MEENNKPLESSNRMSQSSSGSFTSSVSDDDTQKEVRNSSENPTNSNSNNLKDGDLNMMKMYNHLIFMFWI